MEINPLQSDELERFIDELWLPAQREMAAVSEYALTDNIREKGLTHRRSRLPENSSITYLARSGQRLRGYVAAEIQTPPPIFQQVRECHINDLFVRKDTRRQGVAKALLQTVEDWSQARDCERLDLNVNKENQAAKALYEEEGYNIKRHNMKKRLKSDR